MAMLHRRVLTLVNDLLFKKVFASLGNEHILKAFIKDMLKIKVKKVTPVNPYNIEEYKAEKRVYTVVDVKAITDEGEHIIIEMQMSRHKYFFERTQMYQFQAFVNTYGDPEYMSDENDKYSSIRNVFGIFVMNFALSDHSNRALRHFKFVDDEGVPASEIGKTVESVYFNLQGETSEPVIADWLRLFHGQELSDDAPDYMIEVKEIIDFDNLTEGEQEMAQAAERQEELLDAMLAEREREGREEGLQEGREEERKRITEKLKELGMSVRDIISIVGTEGFEVNEEQAEYKLDGKND